MTRGFQQLWKHHEASSAKPTTASRPTRATPTAQQQHQTHPITTVMRQNISSQNNNSASYKCMALEHSISNDRPPDRHPRQCHHRHHDRHRRHRQNHQKPQRTTTRRIAAAASAAAWPATAAAETRAATQMQQQTPTCQ